jgi:hypothetical protein
MREQPKVNEVAQDSLLLEKLLVEKETHQHVDVELRSSYHEHSHQQGQFQVYRELSDQPVSQLDPWLEMQANLETLCDLQQRLSFTVREIRYLLKA